MFVYYIIVPIIGSCCLKFLLFMTRVRNKLKNIYNYKRVVGTLIDGSQNDYYYYITTYVYL